MSHLPAPHGRPTHVPRTVKILALAVFIPTLIGSVLARPADAHTDLVSSSPTNDAVLDVAPDDVVLTFSEEIDPELSAVSVSAGSDRALRVRVGMGDAPTSLVADLSEVGASRGRTGAVEWSVAYRVVSADAHPIAGTVSFTSPPRPVPSSEASASVGADDDGSEPTPASAAEPRREDAPWWRPLPVVGVFALLAVLGAVGWLRIGRADPEPESHPEPEPEPDPEPASRTEPDDAREAERP